MPSIIAARRAVCIKYASIRASFGRQVHPALYGNLGAE
jgi:hypothetical protein